MRPRRRVKSTMARFLLSIAGSVAERAEARTESMNAVHEMLSLREVPNRRRAAGLLSTRLRVDSPRGKTTDQANQPRVASHLAQRALPLQARVTLSPRKTHSAAQPVAGRSADPRAEVAK